MSSKEFIRGTLKTIILKLLAEKTHMYGYEISQRVTSLSNDEIKLTYGALYPVLYKLESEGLVIATTEIVDNRARKYYSLTKQGKEVAREKVSELQRFNEVLRTILLGDGNPNPSLETCSN